MTAPKRTWAQRLRNDSQKYFLGQLCLNVIGVTAATGLTVWIFSEVGDGFGTRLEVMVAVFLVVVLSSLIQTWAAVTNTRQDFLRDRWYLKEEAAAGAEDRYPPNPWRLVAPRALAVGVPAAALAVGAVALAGPGPYGPRAIWLLVGVPLLLVSTVMIAVTLPKDQAAFAAAVMRRRFEPLSRRRYLLYEHILPWIPIQGLINFVVGLKQFPFEAAKTGGELSTHFVGQDAGLVFALIAGLSWFSSQVQVRADVATGRLAPDDRRALFAPLMAGLFIVFPVVGFPIWGGLHLVFGPTINVYVASLVKSLTVMAAVVPGCALGVWWGARRESALLAGKPAGESGETVEEIS